MKTANYESNTQQGICYIGLTQWQHAAWQGHLLQRPSGTHVLSAYSRYFSTVEGNTTFYGLPKPETVEQWARESADQFRFCFKFPQQVTHKNQLRSCSQETTAFLQRLSPLQEKIGLLCIQLPASFSGDNLVALKQYLDTLPNDFSYAIEIRHHDFFAKGAIEREFNQLLMEKSINRISFDTRSLFAHPATDPVSLQAKEHKPKVPVHAIATATNPMLRLIAPLDWQWSRDYLVPWVGKLQTWLDEGRSPYIFLHTPDNAEAPELAAYFVEMIEEAKPDSCRFTPWQTYSTQGSFF
ncbi:MAG: hypothetical protein CSA60_04150 [Neptuniibacter caesariensis]|uniref:DUF72 domain-containing protein n=1 Tax=Neptuniibacter caesariensis TaxID=207954 RepID=A0A2G6JJN7_NEPCE|nr:MAG: hypothetical protein CSA60_04150 [Neptuniibacter caesariensis]